MYRAKSDLNHLFPVPLQAGMILGGGAAVGLAIASRCAITDLPQLVAAFHSLVGLAAAITSIASFAAHPTPDAVHNVAIWLGTLIGGITFTGSVVAFAKLQGLVPSKEVSLPLKGWFNAAALAGCVAALLPFLSGPAVTLHSGLQLLGITAGLSAFLGAHMTMAIGGADTPVVITTLNSSSGWALCAEGFVLSNSLLTVVGALIGASGAILSLIMVTAPSPSPFPACPCTLCVALPGLNSKATCASPIHDTTTAAPCARLRTKLRLVHIIVSYCESCDEPGRALGGSQSVIIDDHCGLCGSP